tara:strand:- start:1404 stop:1715 length:312 start_codon:yes stop_codon:yes gene_type:complete
MNKKNNLQNKNNQLDSNIKNLDKSLAIYAKQSMECDRVIKEARMHKEMCMEKLRDAMGNHTYARLKNFNLNWGVINYKAQPEKTSPAKPAYSIRKKTIIIKEF